MMELRTGTYSEGTENWTLKEPDLKEPGTWILNPDSAFQDLDQGTWFKSEISLFLPAFSALQTEGESQIKRETLNRIPNRVSTPGVEHRTYWFYGDKRCHFWRH